MHVHRQCSAATTRHIIIEQLEMGWWSTTLPVTTECATHALPVGGGRGRVRHIRRALFPCRSLRQPVAARPADTENSSRSAYARPWEKNPRR